MKEIIQIIGGLFVIQGAGGLIVNLIWGGTWGLVGVIPFLREYAVFSYIVLGVVGVLIVAAAEKLKK